MYSIKFNLRWTKIQSSKILHYYAVQYGSSTTTIFNKENGCFDGFINYGENIIGDDENIIGGYIVRAMVNDIQCEVCAEALLYKKDQMSSSSIV